MRPSLLLILVLLLACSDDPVQPGDRRSDISGSVALVKTGVGVPNIVAVLLRDAHIVATAPTDASGAFHFRDVAPGAYTVKLTGLELSGLSLRHTSFEPITQQVTAGAAATDVVFAAVGLVPGRILGDITCDGVPVAGVTLRVVGGQTNTTVQSNDQGRYAATDLDAGHYTVLMPAAPPGCVYAAPWHVADVRIGQSVEVDFDGTR